MIFSYTFFNSLVDKNENKEYFIFSWEISIFSIFIYRTKKKIVHINSAGDGFNELYDEPTATTTKDKSLKSFEAQLLFIQFFLLLLQPTTFLSFFLFFLLFYLLKRPTA